MHLNFEGPELPELFLIWTHPDFETDCTPQQLTWLLQSGCLSEILWKFLNVLIFFLYNGFLSDQQKRRKVLSVMIRSFFKLIFLQLYLLHFSIKVSINGVLFEADYSIPSIMKFVTYVGVGNWLTKNGRSAIGTDISWFSNASFSKTTALISSIDVWIDSVLLIDDSLEEQSLILFLRSEFW